MFIFNKYFNSSFFFFNNLLLYKFFSKFIYSKFLIIDYDIVRIRRKKFFFIDNFFEILVIKLAKRYRKLGFSGKFKSAFFFKADLFIYKQSKFQYYKIIGILFKTYIKKNIYLNLQMLKNSLGKKQLFFIFKSIRGGFIGFSNKLCGFLPLNFFNINKKRILFYKKYFLFNSSLVDSFFNVNCPSLFFFSSGYIRNFNKIKKSLRHFFFTRFKFVFFFKNFFFKKFVKYILRTFLRFNLYNSKIIIFSLFFKLFLLLTF